VTQQFNTTTSMGRLTLNVLLSFAQFEREVLSDRIRDKIRGIVADLITGGAVLEYGPTEISPPFGQMFSRPTCLCRPGRSSRPGHPGKTAASRPRKANSRERQVRT
jgi:hypothetical protein